MVLLMMLSASHDANTNTVTQAMGPKSHVTPLNDYLDLRNVMVLLMTPAASSDINANGKNLVLVPKSHVTSPK